jgi:hypothetical protein
VPEHRVDLLRARIAAVPPPGSLLSDIRKSTLMKVVPYL